MGHVRVPFTTEPPRHGTHGASLEALATQHVTITESRVGETGGAMGAAIMVSQHMLGPGSALRHDPR